MSHLLRKGSPTGSSITFPPGAATSGRSCRTRRHGPWRRLTQGIGMLTLLSGTVPANTAWAQTPVAPRFLSQLAPMSGTPESPIVLRLPAGARMAAMANVGITSTDADALFYNPGMLQQARGVSASVQRYGSAATTGSMASVQTVGGFAIAMGAQFLDYRSASTYDYTATVRQGGSGLSDGGPFHAASSAFTLGVAGTVLGFRTGTAVKYVEDRIGPSRDGGMAVDLGVSRPLGFGTVAVAMQNIGAGLTIAGIPGQLPTRLTVGYGGALAPIGANWDIGFQTQVAVERDGFVRPAGGMELAYVPLEGVAVVVRQGLRLPRERDEPLVTGGLGVTVDRWSLDYAVEPMRGGRPVSHRLGIRVR